MSSPARIRRLIGALTAALALALPAAASAAPAWDPPSNVPNSATAASPDVALDDESAATAVWARSPGAIVAATRRPDQPWPEPTQLGTGIAPNVALGPNGTATAVWARIGADAPVKYEVWSASRDADGSWSDEELVSSAQASSPITYPQVEVDGGGNATAAWIQDCSIYASRKPARGVWSLPVAVWTDTTGSCVLYQIGTGIGESLDGPVIDLDADAAGNVTVVWRSGYRISGNPMTIRSSVYTAGAWSAPREVATATVGARNPRVAVWHDGRAVVTWAVANAGVRAVARPAGANAAWETTPTELSTTESSPDPVVAYDGHGNASVAWDEPATGDDPATIELVRRDGAGTWGAAETTATIADGQLTTGPRLALGSDGGASVAWTRDGDAGRVVQTAGRPAGGAWSEPVTQGEEHSGDTDAVAPAIASDVLGNAVLAWTDRDESGPVALNVLRTARYSTTPASGADWTANGLTGSSNLHSWIDYVFNGGGDIEATAGASRPDPNDRYSYRLSSSDAWIEQSTGETVVQLRGSIAFKYPGHFIDIRIVDPKVVVAADGASGRIVADGQGSGDMASAMAGNPQVDPFSNLHILDLKLPAPVVSSDGSTRSWIAAPAEIATDEVTRYLAYGARTPYGFFTVTAPASLPTRDTRPPVTPPPGGDDGPDDAQKPTPPIAKPSIARLKAQAVVGRNRVARVVRLSCPAGSCKITAPKRIRVKIAGKRFWATVLAPTKLRAGRKALVRVKLTPKAAKRLARRKAKPRIGLRVAIRPQSGPAVVKVVRVRLAAKGG